MVAYFTCVKFNTNVLHKALSVNYCCDMFRPELLAVFRELVSCLACAACATTFTVRILLIVFSCLFVISNQKEYNL